MRRFPTWTPGQHGQLMCVLGLTLIVGTGCRTQVEFKDGVVFDTGGSDDTATAPVDADGDGYGQAEDCDDENADIHPGATELCDGLDNDCDEQIDEEDEVLTDTWYRDADEDGYGNAETSTESCGQPSGYVDDATDCDDLDPDTFPGAPERCDGLDNDCDGEVDEEVRDTWYGDGDGDGFGSEDTVLQDCDPPSGYGADATDCDDTDPLVSPLGTEICNEVDDDCDGLVDEDAADADTWYLDSDGDGFGDLDETALGCEAPSGHVDDDSDCDDERVDIFPGAEETCDGTDEDCDGEIDEDAIDEETFYIDYDGDGYGSSSYTWSSCELPSGYVDDDSDCDDTEASIHPDAEETCDGLDNDCDDEIDEELADADTWYADADGDGYGDAESTTSSCEEPTGYVDDDSDCDDDNETVNPGADETCDGEDQDCDGEVDEEASDTLTWYADTDGDGYGDPDATSTGCEAPSGYGEDTTDCDDDDDAVHPDAEEICNEVDDDCDGLVDDEDPGLTDADTWYLDYDGDGYGAGWVSQQACEQPSDYIEDDTDCDDIDEAVFPGADEECNGVDDDCDELVDEEGTDASTWYEDADGDGFGSADSSTEACDAPSGHTDDASDCDDDDETVNPDAEEVCNALDDNCDGEVDDGLLGLDEECAADDCLEILEEDSAADDDTYWIDLDGVATETLCDMSSDGGGWTLIFTDNFDDTPASGWSLSDTTTCGDWGTILGGYGIIAGDEIDITLDTLALDHTEAWVELDYIAIDSWDGEAMYLVIDGSDVWAEAQTNHSSVYGEVCGWDRGYYGSYDSLEPVSEIVEHSDKELELVVGSTLDQNAYDESFGIDNVWVWVR